jgi:hypothetical protein
VDYDLTKYVKLGQYKGVEVENYPYELTDESVQQQIQIALSNYAQQKEKTDAIQLGDQAVIDFTGYVDGETFAEIAKMMKFKNRERNLVDSISVELSIKDNKIEVYPFMMVMDRFSTAISGKQDMDMNLDYHISVIKSPLPLRLGIDITGNIDDFKIRPGKVLYKSANLPVYTKFIDSTRVNLREYIYNIHNK